MTSKKVAEVTTRQDVASKAGVSPSTVSRVVNGNGYVAQDVRFRVERAIEELSYVPNRIARSLRMNESMQIACITHNITNPFYGEIILGLEDVLFQHGYTLSLYTSNFTERDYRRTIGERMFDGLVVLSPVELSRVVQLKSLHDLIPMAVYWDFMNESPVSSVTIDLRSAMKHATQYLLERGHRRIAFLGHETIRVEENPRFQGYLEAHTEANVSVQPELILTTPAWGDSTEFGYQKLGALLLAETPFTGLVASNDLLAIGALRALYERGIKVPDAVSVIGFDDLDIARYVTPALTTVRVPKRRIGEELALLLLDELRGESFGSSVTLGSEFIARETVRSLLSGKSPG